MKYFPLLIALLALASLVGCSHADTAAKQDDGAAATTVAPTPQSTAIGVKSSAARHMPQASANPAPPPPLQGWVSHNPNAPRDIVAFADTNVPACDALAAVVRQCINRHTTGKQRGDLRRDFSRKVSQWRKELGSGASATSVASECTAYRSQSRGTYQAVGCSGV